MSPVHAGVEAIQRDTAGKLSATLACILTTSAGTSRVRARLISQPSHPQAVTAAVTDRAGVVHLWAVGRELLEAGMAAPASRPARGNRIWLWTCDGPAVRSLMVARASPWFEVLELDCAVVGAFLTRQVRAEEAVVVHR
jgi:hypothetical protein